MEKGLKRNVAEAMELHLLERFLYDLDAIENSGTDSFQDSSSNVLCASRFVRPISHSKRARSAEVVHSVTHLNPSEYSDTNPNPGYGYSGDSYASDSGQINEAFHEDNHIVFDPNSCAYSNSSVSTSAMQENSSFAQNAINKQLDLQNITIKPTLGPPHGITNNRGVNLNKTYVDEASFAQNSEDFESTANYFQQEGSTRKKGCRLTTEGSIKHFKMHMNDSNHIYPMSESQYSCYLGTDDAGRGGGDRQGSFFVHFSDSTVFQVKGVPESILKMVNALSKEGGGDLQSRTTRWLEAREHDRQRTEKQAGVSATTQACDDALELACCLRRQTDKTVNKQVKTTPEMKMGTGSLELVAIQKPEAMQSEQNAALMAVQMDDMMRTNPATWLISSNWVSKLLMECADAITKREKQKIHYLTWVVKSLATQSDSTAQEQKIAELYLEVLQSKAAGIGTTLQRALAKKKISNTELQGAFESILAWKEFSPFMAVGHVASNAAIWEALRGEEHIHILDASHWNNVCLQWPTLLEALATRPEGPPRVVRITVIVLRTQPAFLTMMQDAATRLTKFSRRTNLPFQFHVHVYVYAHLHTITSNDINLLPHEALAINLNQSLHSISPLTSIFNVRLTQTSSTCFSPTCPRDLAIKSMFDLHPKIVCVFENEVDQLCPLFSQRFQEIYRFFSILLGSLENKPKEVAQLSKLQVDNTAKIFLLRNIACDQDLEYESQMLQAMIPHQNSSNLMEHDSYSAYLDRMERLVGWRTRFMRAKFEPFPIGRELIQDVHALLNMYSPDWGMEIFQRDPSNGCFILTWRQQPFVNFSTWRMPSL